RQLADAVRRLPLLIDAAEPSLRQLATVVTSGTPVVRQLHAAAPRLNRLSADIGPFARQVKPALKALRPLLVQGAATLKKSVPLSKVARDYAHSSRPSAELAGKVFT